MLGWLKAIVARLEAYDPADLLTAVAALQTLPQNAERTLRLELLANLISTLPAGKKRPGASVTRLRRMCNEQPLEGIRPQEDPSEQPFTDSITFIGGSYVVFSGIADDATFVLKHLALAILQFKDRFPRAFHSCAVRTLGAGLGLSNLIASRAGLGRGTPPIRGPKVAVPHSADLARLKQAIQVDRDTLQNALAKAGFDVCALEPLTTLLGEATVQDCTLSTGPLDARPLIRIDNSIVLAAPGLLLPALRHRLICLAQEHGVSEILADSYRRAVWHTVTGALDLLKHRAERVPLPPMPDAMPTVDGVFGMDSDKVLYVTLSTDDLAGYSANETFGTCARDGLGDGLEQRQRVVEEFLFQGLPGLNEIVVLHLISGLGRGMAVGLGGPFAPLEAPLLLMKASGLEVIALLEDGNPLMLHRYAISSSELREHTEVIAWSELDEFSVYRSHEYSYYLSDDGRPTLISISVGTGLELRLQVMRDFDPHAVPAFRPGHYINVTRTWPTTPIYAPIELLQAGRQFALMVEGLPVPVWVVGPDHDHEPGERALSDVYAQMVDMVAYWIWQFSPSLARPLRALEGRASALIVELRTVTGEGWRERGEERGTLGAPVAEYEVPKGESVVRLQLHSTLQRRLEGPDNEAERALMAVVLSGIGEVLSACAGDTELTSEAIQKIIEEHAPLGRKKKLLILNPDENPALAARGLPSHRNVQPADKAALLDEVGVFLTEELGLPVGPTSREDRTEVLGRVVGYLYRRLGHLVSSLTGTGLIDWLVSYHEAICYDMAHLKLTIPTRLACFDTASEMPGTISEEMQDLYQAGQTARFVIEYVGARPPTGLRPMSLSVYDELQALASEIIQWADMSDLIHYGIEELDLSILPSGRLGSNYRGFVDKIDRGFVPLHTMERVDAAVSGFDRHWRSDDATQPRPPEAEEVDRAFRAEYGYTLTELTTLMGDCINLGGQQEQPVKSLPADQIISELARSTALPSDTVVRMLEDLCLEAREDFLHPPAPFTREDVYPWRFGRPLSYIRRPLIRTMLDGEPTLVWGNLHLYESLKYGIELCLTGRLQARANTEEMKSLLARFHKQAGSEFTAAVKSVFDGCAGSVVDSNVKKIGRTKLKEGGEDLGDIDVLVIDPQRHRILVVECKDLSVARNPHEMATELETLFVGRSGPSTTDRHQRRTEWVRKNVILVLQHYGVPAEGEWRVDPMLVISQEMATPHVHQPSMRVMSLRTLERDFVPTW